MVKPVSHSTSHETLCCCVVLSADMHCRGVVGRWGGADLVVAVLYFLGGGVILAGSVGPVLGKGGVWLGRGSPVRMRVRGGGRVPNHDLLLDNLNNDPSLDASNILNNFIQDDEIVSHFLNSNLSSKFYDISSLKTNFQKTLNPLLLSVNIQSLNSKFNDLKIFITELINANVPIDVIVMQETWNINYPHLLELPGFQPLIYRNRNNMRGGGVGFYIRKGLNFKRKIELEQFQQKHLKT